MLDGMNGGGYGSVTNCENYGEIEGTEYIGGITGSGTTTTNCKNYAYIKGVNYCGRIRWRRR